MREKEDYMIAILGSYSLILPLKLGRNEVVRSNDEPYTSLIMKGVAIDLNMLGILMESSLFVRKMIARLSRYCIVKQSISEEVCLTTRCSASKLERNIACCFLLRRVTRFLPTR